MRLGYRCPETNVSSVDHLLLFIRAEAELDNVRLRVQANSSSDHLSANKTQASGGFLSEHRRSCCISRQPAHGACTTFSLWFAKISRDVITRGVFSSVADLKSNVTPYIRQYNKNPAS